MRTQILILPLLLFSIYSQSFNLSRFSSSQPSQFSSSLNPVTSNFPNVNLNTLTVGPSLPPNATTKSIINAIINGTNQVSTPVQTAESLFQRFPSKAELNKIVDDGDTAAISKTLQSVAADDAVICSNKVSYIYQLLGIVKAALLKKNLASDQLSTIITGAKKEIKRLEQEISRVTKQRNTLGLTELQNKINQLVNNLRNLYDQYNSVKTLIPPQMARVNGMKNEIQTYTKQSDQQRNKISNDKLKLATTISQIKDLEDKLKTARDTQATLQISITTSQSIIKQNDDKVAIIRANVAEVNSKIKLLNNNADQIKRKSNTLQVDVQRVRTDISVNQEKDKDYIEQIRNFQVRISLQKVKLVEDERNKIQTLIDNLQFALPTIQAQINRQYYYCYGEGKVQTITTGKTTVYVVKSELFPKYVANAYGVQSAPQIKTGTDVKFQVSETFSSPWIKQFGPPKDVAKAADFSCLGLKGTSLSGKGVIYNIDSDSIDVKDERGRVIELNLGACSRVEAITDLPMVGQRILWRGSYSTINGYSLFSASCY